MRKNNTAIIFGSLFFSCSVMAANGTLAPTVVPMVNGGQASIAISNTSPNLFTVPGDRIIAVNSLDGALTNNEQTASGGVVVATVNKKPFTFILETERGLNLSIQAVPREGAGRTIQLVSDLRGTGEEAGAWETSTPYESLLVTISQAVRGGKLPAGWYQVPVTKETLQAPAGLSSVADAVWTGNHLKMVRFAVENKTLSALNIRESDFWQPGTRAVMFSQPASQLSLVKDGATDGVQIDPTLFSQYGIRTVPALVVFCSQGYDIIRGNLRVGQALEKVAATGDCRQVAHDLLAGKGDSGK